MNNEWIMCVSGSLEHEATSRRIIQERLLLGQEVTIIPCGSPRCDAEGTCLSVHSDEKCGNWFSRCNELVLVNSHGIVSEEMARHISCALTLKMLVTPLVPFVEMHLERAYYEAMKRGEKETEVRMADHKRLQLKVGQVVQMTSGLEGLLARVKHLRTYRTLTDLYAAEDPNEIVPGGDAAHFREILEALYAGKFDLPAMAINLEVLGSLRTEDRN